MNKTPTINFNLKSLDLIEYYKSNNDLIVDECELILDKKFRIVKYDKSFFNVFTSKINSDLNNERFGDAIGCSDKIDDGKQCGYTSKCDKCSLRISTFSSYFTGEELNHKFYLKKVYNSSDKSENLVFDFSTKQVSLNGDKFVSMTIKNISCK